MTDDSATLLEIRDLLKELLVEVRAERPSAPAKRSRKSSTAPDTVSDLDRARANRVLDKLGLR